MSDRLSADLASLKIDREAPPGRSRAVALAIGAAAVAGVGALVYVVLVPYLAAKIYKTEVRVTEIARVSPAQSSVELTSAGYVVPQKVSNVAPKVAGRVATVNVDQGDEVAAGDVLFTLDVADQQAAIASARSRVAAARARAASARATLAAAKQQAERAAAMAGKGVTPRAEADDLAAKVRSLQAQVHAADADVRASAAEVAALEVNLDSFEVRTPLGGRIVSEPPEIGEVVGPTAGMIAGGEASGSVEIADFGTLQVECDVPEARLHVVEIGGPAEIILDAFPGERRRGEVVEIVPRVNRAKATVTVKVGFADGAGNALPDMSARVSFLSARLDDAELAKPPKLIVPGAALAERGGRKVVFVVDGDTVKVTPVVLGPAFGDGFELVEGPEAGTRVVANPPSGLADGQRIKERKDG